MFENFHKMIQTQFQAIIQVLRIDNGKEYLHNSLGEYLVKHGMVHQTSCLNSPQEDEFAERKNRHTMKVSRSFMLSTNVPRHFWDESIISLAYLMNRMSSETHNFKPLLSYTQTPKFLATFWQKSLDIENF